MAQEERPADVVRFRTSVARRKLTELLLERERFELSAKSGGGILSYEVWGFMEKDKTVVTRSAPPPYSSLRPLRTRERSAFSRLAIACHSAWNRLSAAS